MTQAEVLEVYRHYDGLNAACSRVKILVSYVSRAFLFKSDILTPIHLGRAIEGEDSKLGRISADDLDYLHENCVGDDGFEGSISALNRRVGFFTGTFWAWRNYGRLGDPEYFGSFGYRKLLDPKCVAMLASGREYDLAAPLVFTGRLTARENFLFLSGPGGVKATEDAIRAVHPEDFALLQEFFDQSAYGFNHEMYVMRKPVFFSFCSWIHPLLTWLLARYPAVVDMGERQLSLDPPSEELERSGILQFPYVDMRDIAFVMERLTALFMYKLWRTTRERVWLCPVISWPSDCEQKWQDLRGKMLCQMMRRRYAQNAECAGGHG